MKTVMITGATSGIGLATAKLLAQNGLQLIICGRRKDRLKDLAAELRNITNVLSLNFDVRDRETVLKLLTTLPDEFSKVDVLINNAGNAHGRDPIHEGDFKDWDAMIDINIKGLLNVSKPIMQQMVDRKTGFIINIGSIAGKEVYPNGNIYTASKHSVDAISKAMRIDLNPFGIKVSQICPGLVETEFSEVRFKGDKKRANEVYTGYQPLQPQDIAELILFMITRPAHVNLADILVLPTAQANASILKKE